MPRHYEGKLAKAQLAKAPSAPEWSTPAVRTVARFLTCRQGILNLLWVQEKLAAAEEHLWNTRLEAALDEHRAKVAAGVSQMREGGASDLEIAVYEAEQAVEEAKIEACLPRPQVRSHPSRKFLPVLASGCDVSVFNALLRGSGVSRCRGGATAQC